MGCGSEEWDAFCGSGFLGNFYHLSDVLEVELGGRGLRFQNAEAAFQALKFKAGESGRVLSRVSWSS